MDDGDSTTPIAVDLVVEGGWVLTIDPARRMIRDGRIVDVGPASSIRARYSPAERLGGSNRIVLPGFVNAHQHLTGDRLVRSAIPDDLAPGAAIFTWAVPIHAAHTPDDDELSATASLAEAVGNGITFTVEAGTVAHPDRVLAGFDRVGVGGTLGSWGWDVEGQPWAGSIDEVLARQREVLRLTADHDRVHGWITLVGHDLMSDDLVVAASELARASATGLTFHLSPTDSDPTSYLARTGDRPLVHLDRIGALGDHVLVAHGVHLDDRELDVLLATRTALAYCPWAYLRLGQGVTGAGRHAELVERGGRVALGCDAENAADAIDILRAATLAAGLAKDTRLDPTRFGAHAALEMATIGGAEAIGMGHEIGSLEVGKRADIVLIDTDRAEFTPASPDPVLPVVWATDGRAVAEVVASGRVVVRDGACITVDHDELRAATLLARDRLLAAARLAPAPAWPVTR
ncbi:MAG: amidohydrolase family protein [Ilumatobacteraceae bacterium]